MDLPFLARLIRSPLPRDPATVSGHFFSRNGLPPHRYAASVTTRCGQVWQRVHPADLHERLAEGASLVLDRYVRWQMDRSRTELRRARLDAVFLHNPEHGQQPRHGGELADRLRAAFTVLEAEAAAGHLTSYGVPTWEGFADGVFTVPQLDRLAAEAAGGPEHHLCVVQLPVSLVMADHLGESLHGYGPIHQAADRG
ncbi:hypothetical protein [Streptomyces sp. NPDC101776]|uniref:hypothetical protein n=1 Tax=Streptomyces sp. NPDC101776 TaxID=3366146 RepID=UPI003800C9B6